MHLDLIPIHLALFGLPPWAVIPIAGMIFGGVMALSAMYFENRERQRWHETARLALEKGQPVPPCGLERRQDSRPNEFDLRGGLVLIALGAGLAVFLKVVADDDVAWIGAIPGFIGIALLAHGLFAKLSRRKEADVPSPNT